MPQLKRLETSEFSADAQTSQERSIQVKPGQLLHVQFPDLMGPVYIGSNFEVGMLRIPLPLKEVFIFSAGLAGRSPPTIIYF